MVVGAINEQSASTRVNGDQLNNNADESGAAYVFTRSQNVRTQQACLKASNPNVFDGFGIAIAILDDRIAVGA